MIGEKETERTRITSVKQSGANIDGVGFRKSEKQQCRYAAEQIEFCTGKEYDTIYIVGGGTKDKLLSSFTASACNKNVSAGPTEASVLGNIALQLLAEGKIKTLRDARRIISNSEEVTSFTPSEPEAWNKKYQTFKEVVSLA